MAEFYGMFSLRGYQIPKKNPKLIDPRVKV